MAETKPQTPHTRTEPASGTRQTYRGAAGNERKRLLDRILDSQAQDASAVRLNKAAFLAAKEEIQEALDANVPMKKVHRQLFDEGTLSIGYTTFRTYCREEGLAKRRAKDRAQKEENRTTPAIERGLRTVQKLDLEDEDLI